MEVQILDAGLSFAYQPGTRNNTYYIILHHAAADSATVEQIHSWHLNRGWAGIGYHFYVRKDGSIYQGRPVSWIGAHTTNYNSYSVGICFEGNFENEEMNDTQKAAGQALIQYVQDMYNYTLDVRKHKDFNATACPGANFPFDELVNGSMEEPADTNPEEPEACSDWATEYCDWAVANGIFTGDGNGDYRWHDYLTREEMAVLVKRIFDSLS